MVNMCLCWQLNREYCMWICLQILCNSICRAPNSPINCAFGTRTCDFCTEPNRNHTNLSSRVCWSYGRKRRCQKRSYFLALGSGIRTDSMTFFRPGTCRSSTVAERLCWLQVKWGPFLMVPVCPNWPRRGWKRLSGSWVCLRLVTQGHLRP